MGEMADMEVDRMMGDDDGFGDSNFGYEPKEWRGYFGRPPQAPKKKTCKYCGEGNLHWGYLGSSPWLHNSKGEPHQCKPDFEMAGD